MIYPMQNVIQNYPWGSRTLLSTLTGCPNRENQTQAEVWMGSHPRGSSRIFYRGQWTALETLIREDRASWLGRDLEGRYRQLPFLFKILTAAEPLSIQAHPSLSQAEEGFQRENSRGIDLSARDRSYRDQNHKPEVLCALTPFRALCGFRDPAEVHRGFQESGVSSLLGDAYVNPQEGGIQGFFSRLMQVSPEKAAGAAEKGAAYSRWCRHLQQFHPGDIGVLAPLYLNTLELEPGQALYIPAGILHSYIEGAGVELMANSDNVLRGGLTGKYIDVDELMNILQFEPHAPWLMSQREDGRSVYAPPVEEFQLEYLPPGTEGQDLLESRRGPSIVLAVGGPVSLIPRKEASEDLGPADLKRGEAAFIPPGTGPLAVGGPGGLYRAAVPE